IATRLVSVIQAVQLGRETGTLIAKRRGGISTEEGRIVFTNGRITEVSMNSQSASDAFNYISTWENCLVSFIPQDPLRTITHLFESSTMAVSNPSQEQKPAGPSTPLPRGARPVREHRQNQAYDTPVAKPTQPVSLSEQELMAYTPVLMRPLPVVLYRIEQTGLSRAHRQLALLINGERSVEDLVHVMGRTFSNIQGIVQDLKRLGLI
ncbi:MAG: DUF4388 domain-containing protein, partial [Ktedonobacteraceae bacterium]|nr:DUF4388 domain-containing protein [Ktedonobacteraceae bacterium]